MKISADVVVKVMSLPSVGRKTAFRLLKNLKYSISTDSDLIDYITENSSLLRTPLSTHDFKNAFDKAEHTINQSEKACIKLISYFDLAYPTLLKGIDDPALLLSVKGPYQEMNQLPSVAVIGTRGPSEYGYKVGVRLGEVFGESGFNVISGLALGCDTAGHTGCLNRHGFTTAVLAHGLDTIYPKENKQLAAKILDSGGLLVSEYLIGQRPQANYFVERDRIQAGLSQAVIVVETDIKGGTMHTVKFAATNKRIVAAFNHEPKYLNHPKTQGNQYLIKNKTAISIYNGESIEHLKNTLLELSGYALPVRKPVVSQEITPKKMKEAQEVQPSNLEVERPAETIDKKSQKKPAKRKTPTEDKAANKQTVKPRATKKAKSSSQSISPVQNKKPIQLDFFTPISE